MSKGRRSVVLKSPREIEKMRQANVHVAEILQLMCAAVAPGMSTWDVDQIARAEIKRRGVKSAFLGYRGFPATVCVSVNEEIVHGIPRKEKILRTGDIVGLDFGVVCDGYVGDSARTVGVGAITAEATRLLTATEESLWRAIAMCTAEHRLSDIGKAVQSYVEPLGFSVVRDFVGHGIGTEMHEEPQVPNYYDGPRARLRVGMVIAIEPMVNAGTHEVDVLADGWTAVTRDRKLSAHFEHSVAITEGEPVVLSAI